MLPYIDLHVHSTRSDGAFSPAEVLALAEKHRIGTLAFTDHNTLPLSHPCPGSPVRVLRGCEFSTFFRFPCGVEKDVHIVGLFLEPHSPLLDAVLEQEHRDDRIIFEALLNFARDVRGFALPDHAAVASRYSDCRTLRLRHIILEMMRCGIAPTFDAALELLQRPHDPAAVRPPALLPSVTLQQAVEAILDAHGIPVLAHPLRYKVDEENLLSLLEAFRLAAGDCGAMECDYGKFSPAQRAELHRLARRYGLTPSGGSDFHFLPGNRLDYRLPPSLLEGLEALYRRTYGKEPEFL